MGLGELFFVAAIVVGIVGFGHVKLVKKWVPEEVNQAVHDYVQYLYDNKMLSQKGIYALKHDVKTGQYRWKL